MPKKIDPRVGGSLIHLKITWGPDFIFSVSVTPHPLWGSGYGTRKRQDEMRPSIQPSTFDGRPCPPEFVKALTDLRQRGLLDRPRFKAAFIATANHLRDELSNEPNVGFKDGQKLVIEFDLMKPNTFDAKNGVIIRAGSVLPLE